MRIFALFILVTFWNCKTPEQSLQKDTGSGLQILDTKEAAIQILDDDINNFFERVQATERSIQMKKSIEEASLPAYKTFLASDVEDFTPAEKEILKEVFTKAELAIKALNPLLYPSNIKLIKTKGNHYGPGVYYTREECIVIPPNAVNKTDQFYEVMLHEIWHIISRYNPELVEEAYGVFGFEKRCKTKDFELDPILEKQLLINPDGSEFEYAVELKSGQWAMPFISSSYPAFNAGSFMSHLKFGLYYLDGCLLDSKNEVPRNDFAKYFEKITNNTDYIIHPDEIAADNFIFAVNKANGKEVNFDQAGNTALDRLTTILKAAKGLDFNEKD